MSAKKTLPWILTLAIFVICSADENGHEEEKKAHSWNYDKQGGPSRWDKLFHESCGEQKKRQSPVNIETSKVSFVEDLNKINIVFQKNDVHNMTALNNGHTVKVNIDGLVNINGGNLGEFFKIIQLHFHWGHSDDQGSEHRINGKKYPLEMHMVSYDSDRFVSVLDALEGFNSLAVLGTLFNVVEEDNPVFDPIIDALDNIKHKGDSQVIAWIDPSSLLPKDTSLYFRYDGSLTTPPCKENVIWTVFSTQQTISTAQLNKFRELFQHGDEGEEINLVDNFRPPQPLHGRQVYASFQPESDLNTAQGDDGSHSTIVTSSLCLVMGMLGLMLL